MKIILHIGTHKTATTSIQHFLYKNADILKKRGVLYPSYDIIGHAPHYAQLGMANALVGEHHKYTPRDAESFFRAVREHAKDYDLTVLSAEPFYRQMVPSMPHGSVDVGSKEEIYWQKRKAYVDLVAQLIPEAEILLVVRRQAEFAESLYQETIKKSKVTPRFSRFLQAGWYHFCYADQADLWASCFAGLSALSFEDLCADGAPEQAFCHALGIQTAGLQSTEVQNIGMGVDTVILKRFINAMRPDQDSALATVDTLLDTDLGAHFADIGKRSFFANQQAQIAFQNTFQDQNKRLLRYALDKRFAQSRLFSTEFKDGVAFGDHLSPRIISALISHRLHTA